MAHDKSKPGSLLIKGGHLVDPATRTDAPMDVLLRDGVGEEARPVQPHSDQTELFTLALVLRTRSTLMFRLAEIYTQ